MKKETPGERAMLILRYVVGLLVLYVAALNELQNQQYQALRRYKESFEKLTAWETARPSLYYSTCSYARTLLISMIESYELLLSTNFTNDRKHLIFLYALLEQLPPPSGPPRGPFVYNIVLLNGYARIGALRKEWQAIGLLAGVSNDTAAALARLMQKRASHYLTRLRV